jgi:flagellar biosynthesis GTPase FlhF
VSTYPTDQSTDPVHEAHRTQSTDAGVDQSTDPIVDRLAADLRTVRGRTVTYRRAVIAFTLAVAVVVVFAMGTAAVEVQKFAAGAGFATFSSWALDPVVGLALVVLMFGEALVADAGRKAPRGAGVLRHFAGLVTLAMNCWPSIDAGRWDSVLLHAVLPGLLIGFAAVAPRFRRELATVLADLRQDEDRLLAEIADREDHYLRAQAERLAEAARQDEADAAARRAADEDRQRAERWREEEASRRRIDEARQLAEIAAAQAAAEAEAERVRTQAAAERARAESGSTRKTRPSTAKKTAPPARRPLSKDEAAETVAALLRAHQGPKPFVLDWQKLQAEHGGSKSHWYAAKTQAEGQLKPPVHLVNAATG